VRMEKPLGRVNSIPPQGFTGIENKMDSNVFNSYTPTCTPAKKHSHPDSTGLHRPP
jgi:hypothetical protein